MYNRARPRRRAAIYAAAATALLAAVCAGGRHPSQAATPTAAATSGMPALQKHGGVTQLVVDGHPFLILSGETLNSTSSSMDTLEPVFNHMLALHANTLVTPVTWERIEPQEGVFDFSLVDAMIQRARGYNLHLVLLWLATWKNGMSSYDPVWVKADYTRFPRAERKDGTPIQVLSTLSGASWQADGRAYAALMRHLRQVDGQVHTVLMMQVENEVGILGDSRDRSAAANKAFAGPVPAELTSYLVRTERSLTPEIRDRWTQAGRKTSGTWTQVFGPGPRTDEIFMAWNYARYVDHVAAAGKAEYPIPMYANCWLNDPMDSPPGNYPSGCPESQVMDIWKAGAPHIDLLAPDLYAANFKERCDLYTRRGNTLFIPEMNGSPDGARNVFYAVGAKNAIGTSPFGVDNVSLEGPYPASYDALGQVAPILLAHQGMGQTTGFSLDASAPSATCTMGGYELDISLDSIFGHTASTGCGVIVQTGPNEFLGAGAGFRVAFRPLTPGPKYAGIGLVKEGRFDRGGQWTPGRWLNGDETDQGNGWRFSDGKTSVETCTVYRYDAAGSAR